VCEWVYGRSVTAVDQVKLKDFDVEVHVWVRSHGAVRAP
jgi:hypothetical protein